MYLKIYNKDIFFFGYIWVENLTRKENWNFSISFDNGDFIEITCFWCGISSRFDYFESYIYIHLYRTMNIFLVILESWNIWILEYVFELSYNLMQFSKCCEWNWRIKKISNDIVICIVCGEILLYKSFILFKKNNSWKFNFWILRIVKMVWSDIIWWPQQHWKLYTLGRN